MQFVYGPVPSRRLGRSLGIDPLPVKTCNWNCVYCQLGRTRRLRTEREVFYPAQDILAELQEALRQLGAGRGARAPGREIDWITFVGSGEPTLHAQLGELIVGAKRLSPLPVAVITNGSLLHLPELRAELLTADAVMPSVDAGSQELFRRLNRPHSSFSLRQHLGGLEDFRQEYGGKLWVEVMLVEGMNDSSAALEDIARVLQPIRPDAIHLSLPERPPSESWVRPAREECLTRAQAILSDVADVLHPALGPFSFSEGGDLRQQVEEIVRRHPLQEDVLLRAVATARGTGAAAGSPPGEAPDRMIEELVSSGRVQRVRRYGRAFVAAGDLSYGAQEEHGK